MLALCGFGYWVQGFRCFPWLALNFHMAHNLNLYPSTLQLVQNFGNLPMVTKPLYGVPSDALYIRGARRIPCISIGVFLQVLSWGSLALSPVAGKALPTLVPCILLGNLGASVTEVAKDALVAEYGQKHRIAGLQPYAFTASAMGGILGNLVAISEESISRPLAWIVGSIAMVPVLSSSIFCYQTQCLNLDPSVFGMSRVIGQLMLLSLTVLYDCYWKEMPMRKLIGAIQVLYASFLLLDLISVRQINIGLGIPNEVFALCFSGLAETLGQFKILPISLLLASLCLRGCEGSFTSFSASMLCITNFQWIFGCWNGFLAWNNLWRLLKPVYWNCDTVSSALVPLGWIHHVPMSHSVPEKERTRGMSKRT
ncbi:hypothetical protein SLEP1_g46948 [Rubroshorea leprosula]|uniref:Uncharacterized protein n=1 Tax=Rubroshorea leprosula TaxID=152421 RepID=A0AAV5LP09_9ROSI|nr:hypothetical protein SLEP1_g46948 [Rubroshorea leprosula]